jgi:hypothetical protein
MKEIPIDPGADLYLVWYDDPLPLKADPRRFAKVFQATLLVLPEKDSRIIAGHWRRWRRRREKSQVRTPQIELTNAMQKTTRPSAAAAERSFVSGPPSLSSPSQ